MKGDVDDPFVKTLQKRNEWAWMGFRLKAAEHGNSGRRQRMILSAAAPAA
ncbi:MAG: hypothetical protein IPH71_14035 [Proteobacteria bacterium]|jgi:hypothetical protein|nr:hypothetical protein [Pseudomonadota bacterium]